MAAGGAGAQGGGPAALACLRAGAGGVLLRVAARPGASRSAVLGLQGEALRVAVAAPPVDGKANDELLRFVARALGLRRGAVELVRGQSARDKTLRLDGLDLAAATAAVRALLPPEGGPRGGGGA